MRHTTLRLLSAALPALVCAAARADEAPIVHGVTYSHEDVGYANYPHVLRTENRMENIGRAIRFCDQTAQWPDAARFRYDQETAEPLPLFLSHCTKEQRESLVKHMKEGRIAVAATHTTVLADRLNPESGARLFYLSGRHLPDMLGVPAGRTAMLNDVIGVPWSLPIYCEAASVPWLFHGHNHCGRCDELEGAPLVRWTGAGGTGSVMVHSARYDALHGANPAQVINRVAGKAAARAIGGAPPIILYGWDFSLPDMRLVAGIKDWNAKNPAGRRIRSSVFDDFFKDLVATTPPEKVPTATKTGPCQWMDQPITDPSSFGRARKAAERLPAAEKWGAFSLAATGHGTPHWFKITCGWHALLSNYEHTVGAACWRCKDEEGFRHYETELEEHREESEMAAACADQALDGALEELMAHIAWPQGEGRELAVFNPLGHARGGVVKVVMGGGEDLVFEAVDDASGNKTPCQWVAPGVLAFIAPEVPALGYRTFRLVGPGGSAKPERAPAASENTVENAFYRITLNPATGAIASLFDKELGRELVRQDAPQGFGQYLSHRIESTHTPDWLVSPAPSAARIRVERGPVCDIVRVRAKADGVAWLEETFTLWHGEKRVDFALNMDKNPSGRSLMDYYANTLRGKEAIFACMPFDIPDFKAVYQTGGGGVAEPIRDQFNGTGTAFHAVQHFADLSNKDFGVTVSPVDCAVVEFGPPRADAVSRTMPGSERNFEKKMVAPTESSMHLYLLNNMFSTNIRVDQRGPQAFHWALRSHKGDWQAGGAAAFGEGVNQPLEARLLRPKGTAWAGGAKLPSGTHSFASVDAPNVSVATVKPAEWNGSGYIVRLVETEGRAVTAKFSAPVFGALAGARETTLTETDTGKDLAVAADGSVAVALPPYGVKTLRLLPAGKAPAQVHKVAARPLSDLSVSVTWEPVPGAAFYRVYRTEAEDAVPTPLHLVALTHDCGLEDRTKNHGGGWMANRLKPETRYFYRVEAVDTRNVRGPLSGAAKAVTMATAAAPTPCAPGAVEGLRAILVSPLAPVNAVNLLWRSNIEPNVVAYDIHRSTQADFIPSDKTLLAKLPVRTAKRGSSVGFLDHQMYFDKSVAPSTTYHYKVCAVTAGNLRGAAGPEAQATTKAPTDAPKTVAPPIDAKKLLGNDAVAP